MPSAANDRTQPIRDIPASRSMPPGPDKTGGFRKLAPGIGRDYDKVLDWIIDKLGPLPVAKHRRKDVIRARDASAKSVRFAN